MRTWTTAFTVTFTAAYCTQDCAQSPPTRTQNPYFLPSSLSKSRRDLTHSRRKQRAKEDNSKYIRGVRCLSPVCPGRQARPLPGSGACSGSPWCLASCRAPFASSPASGCKPPWDRCEAAAAHGPGWCTRSPAGRRQNRASVTGAFRNGTALKT